MNVARYAEANVYLASDIDRGGMFASFWDFETFKSWENDLIKGLLINRFEEALLNSGVTFLESPQTLLLALSPI